MNYFKGTRIQFYRNWNDESKWEFNIYFRMKIIFSLRSNGDIDFLNFYKYHGSKLKKIGSALKYLKWVFLS